MSLTLFLVIMFMTGTYLFNTYFLLIRCISTKPHHRLTLNLTVFKILKHFLFLVKEVTLRSRHVKQEMKLSFAPVETNGDLLSKLWLMVAWE